MTAEEKKRCDWVESADALYIHYHDTEWGVPLHDDRLLFEFIVLDGFQAGLSWFTILKKRENFRRAFDDFDPIKIARYNVRKTNKLLTDAGIIRNRQKIDATINNAKAFLRVQDQFGSFDHYLWQFVSGKPNVNSWKVVGDIPAKSKESEAMSKALYQQGFKFVGPTICYGFMQAAGMVNDHVVDCFRYEEILQMY